MSGWAEISPWAWHSGDYKLCVCYVQDTPVWDLWHRTKGQYMKGEWVLVERGPTPEFVTEGYDLPPVSGLKDPGPYTPPP